LGMELWRALGANVRETYECYWFLGAQRRKWGSSWRREGKNIFSITWMRKLRFECQILPLATLWTWPQNFHRQRQQWLPPWLLSYLKHALKQNAIVLIAFSVLMIMIYTQQDLYIKMVIAAFQW
jgi:hypothetical protein